MPCCPAMRTASIIASAWASNSSATMNSFTLVCPAAASSGSSASAAGVGLKSTGCST